MEITIYDTHSAMRAIIAAPVAARRRIYHERLLEPLRDYWYVATKRINPQVTEDEGRAMKMLWEVDLEADLSEHARALDLLEKAAHLAGAAVQKIVSPACCSWATRATASLWN
ncbi:MAG TPA: hypothetical protein VGF67_04400 [Ktedonobacteraceae bacterium]|jgi:hypothetical protein